MGKVALLFSSSSLLLQVNTVADLVDGIYMAQDMRQHAFRDVCAALSKMDVESTDILHNVTRACFGELISCLKSEYANV